MAKLFYEHYIKLAHIGKGANAHVYKVRHNELGYIRAIKILNDYIENKDEKLYRSFLNECRTLLTIGNGCHPNIVRIYGPDLIDNHAIVEMDYVQGRTMDSYIKERRFIGYKEVVRFIKDIVGALAYTHHDIYRFLMNPEEDNLEVDPQDGSKYLIDDAKEKELVRKYGIVHNDLHSNNIMRRDYDGSFVLLDFGLAVQDGRCVKSSHVGDGNPEYMAPEKFDCEAASPRSDVYSLGILMYEILAGRVPFELEYTSNGIVTAQSKNRLLNQHKTETPPDILPFRSAAFTEIIPGAEYERDYPEWLDAIIFKCLSKNPGDRYGDARELLDDINSHLESDSPDRQIAELKEEVSRLSALCGHRQDAEGISSAQSETTREDNENGNITPRAIVSEATDSAKVRAGSRKWKIALFISAAALAGAVLWGWRSSVSLENSSKQLQSFINEAESRGLYADSTGLWTNVEIVEASDGLMPSDSIVKIVHNVDTVYIQSDPEVVKETKTVVEYRDSPQFKELNDLVNDLRNKNNKLLKRNKELEGQINRYLESLSQ